MAERRFETFGEAEAGLATSGSSALYASSGSDTMPFSFLHPDFLSRRGLGALEAPSVFFYIDKRLPRPLQFRDEHTLIESTDRGRVSVGPFGGRWQTVRFVSPTLRSRAVEVVCLQAANQDVATRITHEGWAPTTFIGVCDGCRFGGNPVCVNDLANRGKLGRRLPRYWVTDHFKNVQPKHWRSGDHVESADPAFPLRFRKLALLSSEWGGYGGATGLRGATLFQVESVGDSR